MTAAVISRLPDNAVTAGKAFTRWAFGAWSDVEGWPSHVTFYKERLAFGRGQQIWMSVAGDYENFASKDDGGVVTADMAISITVQSDQVNSIQWMLPSDAGLLVGTAGGEFAVQPITSNQVFGPENVTAPQVSSFGSKAVAPLRVADSVLFVQRSGTKLRDVSYDSLSLKFQSRDKTVLAEHITQGGIVHCQPTGSLLDCLGDARRWATAWLHVQQGTGCRGLAPACDRRRWHRGKPMHYPFAGRGP